MSEDPHVDNCDVGLNSALVLLCECTHVNVCVLVCMHQEILDGGGV